MTGLILSGTSTVIMTNRKSLHQSIASISQTLSDLNRDMQLRNDLSVLDIDLLRKHSIDLYDAVNQLRLVMKEQVETEETVEIRKEAEVKPPAPREPEIREEPRPQPEAKTEVPVTEESVSEPVSRFVPDPGAEESSAPEETPVEEPEPTAINEEINEEPEPVPVAQTDPEAPKQENKSTKGDEEEPNDLAYKLGNTPIDDLKQAISIAKKFELINSLFGGDVQKYAYTIHYINNLNSGDEAFEHLHQLKEEHRWDEDDRNFVELANLVRRRFIG